jgi:integrase
MSPSARNFRTRIARQNRYTNPLHTASAERRHTFSTAALDAGVPLRDVQEAASHADPRTTMRYENSQELHQTGEKLQVSSSRDRRDGVPAALTPAS